MKLSCHHHMGTGVQTMDEIDRFMDSVAHIHLKDVRSEVIETVRNEKLSFLDGVRAGAFTVPGDSAIDFAPIFKIINESGYQGWMVVEAEQDPAKANPLEHALKARKYIEENSGL